MAHKGRFYELCFRRDFRMQNFNNNVAFPIQFDFLSTGMVGTVGTAMNGVVQHCTGGDFDPATETLSWTGQLFTVGAHSYFTKIWATVATSGFNQGFYEIWQVGPVLIAESILKTYTQGLPSIDMLGGNLMLATPGIYDEGGFPHCGWTPDFY